MKKYTTFVCGYCGCEPVEGSPFCPGCGGDFTYSKGETLINLTPHVINLPGGVELEPTTSTPRVSVTEKRRPSVCGFCTISEIFGEVENLPERQPDTFYIVSRLVKLASPDRKDLVVPGCLTRDEKGRIIGCKALII